MCLCGYGQIFIITSAVTSPVRGLIVRFLWKISIFKRLSKQALPFSILFYFIFAVLAHLQILSVIPRCRLMRLKGAERHVQLNNAGRTILKTLKLWLRWRTLGHLHLGLLILAFVDRMLPCLVCSLLISAVCTV